ncbi:hypothetical protein ABIB94_009131 [Bradyrhizobium sp. JR7.2]|nr:hypothetical protein CDS [Bradyrhizobium sp.]CUT16386.1 hypothetical protein CDS [Bradyrhizobium sp.]
MDEHFCKEQTQRRCLLALVSPYAPRWPVPRAAERPLPGSGRRGVTKSAIEVS